MNKRRLAVIVFAFASAMILASPASTMVYATKSGTKYHTSTCRSLKKSKIPMTLSEAVDKGLEPCKICNPPRLDRADTLSIDTTGD